MLQQIMAIKTLRAKPSPTWFSDLGDYFGTYIRLNYKTDHLLSFFIPANRQFYMVPSTRVATKTALGSRGAVKPWCCTNQPCSQDTLLQFSEPRFRGL